MDFITFGYWVRRQRMMLDLTQAALAHRVGCSRETIKKIEQGERRPSRMMAARIADSLEIAEEERETFVLCGLGERPISRLPLPSDQVSTGSSPEMIQVHAHSATAVTTGAAAPSTAAPPPNHNLPVQTTPFIGREKNIQQVTDLLRQYRLVTLTGPGGVGKSRLSLQAAQDLLAAFPDGVWLVELASLNDPGLVVQTVIQALGLHIEGDRTHLEGLEQALRPRRVLLVLDNCEHLVEACASLADRLLRSCQDLRLLATSREVLGVRGEAPYGVPSLNTPDPDHLPDLELFKTYEAVGFFEERGMVAAPSFRIERRNMPAVARICHHLDGIPLALELAAARLGVLTTEQLASRLEDVFSLLTQGSRTALPRQQTLKATIDWSYQLLEEKERKLMRRLAVFAGGFSLEGVERVCSGEGISEVEVFDILASLVSKSIVLTKRERGQAVRYRLLEMMRQYAREKLAEAGETQTVRDRHLRYYLELAETSAPKLRSNEQQRTQNCLQREMDNLRLALEWAHEQSQIMRMLQMVSALLRFWMIGRHFSEGCRWTKEALILSEDAADFECSPWRARVMLSLGTILATAKQDWDEARSILNEAETIFRENGDQSGIAHSLYGRGLILYNHKKSWREIELLFSESLKLARIVGDRWLIRKCLFLLGDIAGLLGDHQNWVELSEEAIEVLIESGDPLEIDDPIHSLTIISYQRGETARARRMLEFVLNEYHKPDEEHAVFIPHYVFGLIAAFMGDYEMARTLARNHLLVAQGWKRTLDLAYALLLSGIVNYMENSLEVACLHLEESGQIFKGSDVQHMVGWVYEILGQVYIRQGEVEDGVKILEESLAMEDESFHDGFANKALALGNALRVKGDLERAVDYYRKSLIAHHGIGFLAQIPPKLDAFAKIAVLQSQDRRAARLFGAAQVGRECFAIPVPPVEIEEYDESLTCLRENLGETRLEQLLAQGRSMPLEEAVAYALLVE